MIIDADVPVRSLTPQYLNEIINRGAHSTREHRRVIINDFTRWLVKEGILKKPIPTEVITPRSERLARKINIINEQQFTSLLYRVDCHRLKTALQIGFYMGLRINELLHCRPAWIIDNKFLRVGDLRAWKLKDEWHPKSQREYDPLVAIPCQLHSLFSELQSLPKFNRILGYRSDSTLQRHLKKCFKLLPEPQCHTFSTHHLRHSCISYWLNEKGVPVYEVQRLARHVRIETTMRYYHPDNTAHFNAFNP